MTWRLPTTGAELAADLAEVHDRLQGMLSDLGDEALCIPYLPIVNPFPWELGHAAWFLEHWVLRAGGRRPSRSADADRLYDSSAVAHRERWSSALPARAAAVDYCRGVFEDVLEHLAQREPDEHERYFLRLSLFHADMHVEAFTMMRQTLGLPAPPVRAEVGAGATPGSPDGGEDPPAGDAELSGTVHLGAARGADFAFDNEQWSHPVEVRPFLLARRTVTQAEFAAFVEDRGYARRDLWTAEGWAWREAHGAERPVHWRRDGAGWSRREFDRLVPLEPDLPVFCVSAYEAEAYCRWAGRRLPTEAEWELAAGPGRTPWGDGGGASHARVDLAGYTPVAVGAHAAGDSRAGCRQLLGNVWEWTSTPFGPYPGFEPGPYRDYSRPWFGDHRVLRGGSFATRSRHLSTTWRNFYQPGRCDAWSGFRTAADAR